MVPVEAGGFFCRRRYRALHNVPLSIERNPIAMSWQVAFIKHVGPGGLSGMLFGDWLKVLHANRYSVDARYWPRAALTTYNCLVNSLVRRWEDFRYGTEVERTPVPPPLFVLGIWRSGTTHLHNLLAQDDRFAFPNTYQVLFPHTFLSTERTNTRVMQWFVPATRPMDNVKQSLAEAQEDEFALAVCGLSFALSMTIFPRGEDNHRQFLTLQNATPRELALWKSVWMRFLRKMTFKYHRPLILKSPAHTSRIKVLLELFPDAKFVHIHRDPYAVFPSTIHTWRKVMPWWCLQKCEFDEERVFRDYVEVFDAFFAQRDLIPPQNFCEVAYSDLERDPVGQIERIYQSLKLPDFGYLEPALRDYVQSISGYSRNTFSDLPEETRQRVAREWSRCFDEWGYPK